MSLLPAASVIVTLEDLTLDMICFEHAFSVLRDRRTAGRLRPYVEATMAANPGLPAAGTALPLGAVVRLPAFVLADETAAVRLWDDA